ncbi:hypothetical protein HPB52_024704 [Rhipicephalus sanguineus]|uniref:THAP-type domain-containing protein n=1 Tax=Rhipicephalus sanguineus TaxID=34632 RepID=A0A9D4TDZ2_RHISA|nr:hypothetical protein HPB52_024704 [Rhipicephalus sanguineus]
MWVDFVRRDRNWDWTPAKRKPDCSLHFGPDCYRAGNHRYLLEFGIELSRSNILSQKLCPRCTLLQQSIADASPASEAYMQSVSAASTKSGVAYRVLHVWVQQQQALLEQLTSVE